MKIELGKQYQTRDGREVRIYAVDGEPGYPVHGATREEDEGWISTTWMKDGRYDGSGDNYTDLVEVKLTRTIWLNIYKNDGYETQEEATCYVTLDERIACIQVTFKEGDGL